MNVKIIMNAIIFILLGILFPVDCYRILGFINVVGRSHLNFNNAIFKSLASAGHQVTVVTPFPNKSSVANYTVIDISKHVKGYRSNWSAQMANKFSVFTLVEKMGKDEREFCDKMMNLEEIKQMFQSKEKMFDAMIFQVFIYYDCFLPLAEKWNIPAIATVTHRSLSTVDKISGTPRFPSVFPAENGPVWNLKTLHGRFMNTWTHIVNDLSIYYVNTINGRKFYDTHYEILSPYEAYRKREPSLVFYNNHLSLLPRVLSPSAIEVGGIHLFLERKKSLPPLYQKFVDEAKHGVIIFALGSVFRTSTISQEAQLAFKEAFRQIPQRVIWKFEDPMENVPENVLIQEWVPQRDLLAHPNVKAAISHCGLSGTYELVYFGKPAIATPLFSDQWANAETLTNFGAAIRLDINSVTKEMILDAINRVINDTTYTENVRKLSKRFKNRPVTPQQSVVYWTEYVIENDNGTPLQLAATELYWFQYLLFDVILYVSAFVVPILYFIYRVVKKINVFYSTFKTELSKKRR